MRDIKRGPSRPQHRASKGRHLALLLTLASLYLLLSAAHAAQPPLATVPKVDLQRYAGTWYEIARIDHFFQKGCVGSTATYSLKPNGEIEVINRCRNESDGKPKEARGRAWSVDPKSNARLKVSFFWPFRGDYWIIELGRDYEYAVVGAPNRDYLWILAREKTMDESVYQGIVKRAAAQGFPVQKLIRK